MPLPQTRPLIRAVTFEETGQALDRLIQIARGDSGGARRVVDFLLSWWDGPTGGWSIIEISNVDAETGEDMLIVLAYLAQNNVTYADAWGHKDEIGELIDLWNWKGRGD